jgi:replicative DNA helicase
MSKNEKNNFGYLGVDYQYSLINQIIVDTKFGESIIDAIDPNYFETVDLKNIVIEVKNIKDNYGSIPDYPTIELKLKQISDSILRNFTLEHLNKIKALTVRTPKLIQEEAIKFCKQQELSKAIKKIQKIIDTGKSENFDSAGELIKTALDVGYAKDDDTTLFEGMNEVLADDYRNPIPTGIPKLDEVMNGGLSKTELAVVVAPFGVGKSQPLTSKILTPNGWVTMGEINIGDEVISRDGKATKVIGVYPQGFRPTYKVTFSDGTSTLCDEEHLWSVNTINQRNRSTKKSGKKVILEPDNSFVTMSTKDMIGKVKVWGGRRHNYKVPIVQPVEFNPKKLDIDPYLLGVMLGDGCMTEKNQPHFVTKDAEIINEVSKIYSNISIANQFRDFEVEKDGELLLERRSLIKVSLLGLKPVLQDLGLYGTNSKTKFIPEDYLYTSVEERVNLLQGLMDTDGYVNGHRLEYTTVSERLANDVSELIRSLGGRVNISNKIGTIKGVKYSMVYRLLFSFPNNGIVPIRLKRKKINFSPRTKYSDNKFITDISYYGEEKCQCIMVDNPEHLYVTDDYIVTHNTTLATKIANSAFNYGYNVLQIFFEDQPKVIKRKHYACWTGIELNNLGIYREEVIAKVKEREETSKGSLKLKRFPSDGTTIKTIRKYIEKKISEGFRPDIILLDYIDCVQPSKKFDDYFAGEGNVMREFETMLSDFNIAGWTFVQGNRSSIKSEVVEADQIGGSIKKGQIGHFIMSIAKTLPQKDSGHANIAILKSRFGKDGLVFTDCVFDNARIQIEIREDQNLVTEFEAKTGINGLNQQTINSIRDRIQKDKSSEII